MATDMTTRKTWHTVLPTALLGDLTLVRDESALRGLYFRQHWYRPDQASFGPSSGDGFDETVRQLEQYLTGQREKFEVTLDVEGSKLQRRVWDLIAEVPYGRTTTYGALARRLAGDVTPQEVGAAVGRNPLSIVIPCHRVIGSTGKLVGYAGGTERKRVLLELEQPTLLSAVGLPATG